MCGPAAAAIVSIGTSLIGGVMQARAQSRQASAQAALERRNAIIAQQNADFSRSVARDARERGKVEEQKVRLERRRELARQTAAAGASGFDVGSGSPLDVIAGTAQIGELEALTVRANADREAFSNLRDAYNFESRSGELEAQAGLTERAGRSRARGSLLSTAGDVAGKWYTFKNDGVF